MTIRTPDNRQNAFMQTMQSIQDLMKKMNDELTDVKETNINFDYRLNNLENTYPITRTQANNITKRVKSLAREIVGYPSYIYGVTIQDIYRYLRDYYNLANAVGDTEKQYYNNIIQGIEHYRTDKFDKQRLIDHKDSLEEAKQPKNKRSK